MDSTLSVISLFSGAGGFDLGFQRAGFTTYLANELLESAAQTLADNLKMKLQHVPAALRVTSSRRVIQGSITDISFPKASSFEPDVLIGGPPCQDYSVVQAQRRKGMRGTRGKLYSHLVNALLIFRPKVFVFENVQGLVSADGGKTYDRILDDLANLGSELNGSGKSRRTSSYELLYSDVIDAAKHGVPQIRKRLIVLGIRRDLLSGLSETEQLTLRKWAAEQLTGGSSLIKQFPLTILEILQGQPLSELQDVYQDVMDSYENIWKEKDLPLAKVWKKQVWKNLTLKVVDDYLAINQIEDVKRRSNQIDKAMEEHEAILSSFGWLNQPIDNLNSADGTNRRPRTTRAVRERMFRIPPDENHAFVEETPWEVAGKGISFIYRRAFPLKPAPTVMAYGGGGTYGYHYLRTRDQLSLRERARIQTFPDSFLFKGSGEEKRAQIGEAVPPLMAERIACVVREVLFKVDKRR